METQVKNSTDIPRKIDSDEYWEKCRKEAPDYYTKWRGFPGRQDDPATWVQKLEDQLETKPYETLLESLKNAGCRSVLDVGCGSGRVAWHLAKAGFEVAAVDLSEDAVKDAQDLAERCGEEKLEGSIVVQGAQEVMELNLSGVRGMKCAVDEGFDAVIVHEYLHQERPCELGKFREKIVSLLRDGGVLFICAKSTNHGLFGTGTRIRENVFETRKKRPVHYFDESTLEGLFLNPCADGDAAGDWRFEREWMWEVDQPERQQKVPGKERYVPRVIYYLGRMNPSLGHLKKGLK